MNDLAVSHYESGTIKWDKRLYVFCFWNEIAWSLCLELVYNGKLLSKITNANPNPNPITMSHVNNHIYQVSKANSVTSVANNNTDISIK